MPIPIIKTESEGSFTTAVPPTPSDYDPAYTEWELNEIKQSINTLALSIWFLTGGTATGDRTEPGATAKTDDYDIVEDTDNGVRFSNVTATKTVTYHLPSAATTLEYEFSVDAAHDIYLIPALGERFQLGTTNQLMRLQDTGTLVRIGCTNTAVWRILKAIGTVPTYVDAFRYVGGRIWTMISGDPVQAAGS